MQQDDRELESQKLHIGWLRWIVASMVGGVVSASLVFVVPRFLAVIVSPPRPGLDIRFVMVAMSLLMLGVIMSGPAGGWVHWIIVGRPAVDVRWFVIKWSIGFWFALAGVAALLAATARVVDVLGDSIGAWGVFILASAMIGLIIVGVLGDTRPRRRVPGA